MSEYVLHVDSGRFFVSGREAELALGSEFPTLLTQTLIVPESKTAEGILIAAIAFPWRKIRDSSRISTRLSRDSTWCLSGLGLRLAVFDGF